jgi:hypothetical protein
MIHDDATVHGKQPGDDGRRICGLIRDAPLGPGRCHIDPVAGQNSVWLAWREGLLGPRQEKPATAQAGVRTSERTGQTGVGAG